MVHERKPALHSSALTRLKICRGPDHYRRNARSRMGAFDLIKACHRRTSDLCGELKS